MCNSFGPTWAISGLSVLLRAMQGRTDNCQTAIELNDEEVSFSQTQKYGDRELSCFLYIFFIYLFYLFIEC
jgi:hypothetical protein